MSSEHSGEGSAAANWLGAQFAGRLVKKLGNMTLLQHACPKPSAPSPKA